MALMFALLLITLCFEVNAERLEIGQEVLRWNISATAKIKRQDKPILTQLVGCMRKGRVHAVIGPSGSGKTTLLLALSETVQKGSLKLYGEISVPEFVRIQQVFVAQEDLLFAQLTTLETLQTAVKLRSPLSSRGEMQSLVDDTILSLGLKKVRSTVVGDSKTRGLSGGEKKRLAFAEQLIGTRLSNNNNDDEEREVVIFADECTSGLDAYQAQNVVALLKDLAVTEGHTILTTIHQPRASIYNLFDDITLLSEGRVMYTGSREGLVPYFAAQGHRCPPSSTPAEFFIDLVSIDYSSPEAEEESRGRVDALAGAFREQYLRAVGSRRGALSSSSSSSSTAVLPRKRNGGLAVTKFIVHFKTLLLRSWRQVTRDRPLNIARFASSVFSALLFGAIYFKLGKGAGTVPDRLGLLQVAAVNTAMTSLIKATTSFVSEKLIVNRERRSDSYAVFPYFAAKLLAEAPIAALFPCLAGGIIYKLCGLNDAPGRLLKFLGILTLESFASSSLGLLVGSFSSSVDSAIAVAPSVMVIFIVFGGLYVVNTPSWLSWVPRASLIRWAYEALSVNEFSDLKLLPEAKYGPKAVSTGEEVLESMGMGKSTIMGAIKAQAFIILFNYVATYLSLVCQKPKFEILRPYPTDHRFEQAKAKAQVIASAPHPEEKGGLSSMPAHHQAGFRPPPHR